jgi:hypothetical protein
LAKVENTGGRREVHSLTPEANGNTHFAFPAARTVGLAKFNGCGEIPDALLDELLEKDDFTKALFASGHLIDTREKPEPAVEAEPAKTPA